MASQGVNALRWGALVFGVFYGFSHQTSITARDRNAASQKEFEHKQKLIDQARAEWRKKTQPRESSSGNDGVISDMSDPNFDLDAYLSKAVA